MTQTSPHRMSVAVCIRQPHDALGETLEALTSQQRRDEVEVLLADACPDGFGSRVAREFSGVRVLRLEPVNMPAVKAAAIRSARGEIVAFLDPWAVPEPGWVGEVLAGFSDDRVRAVGGAVLPAGSGTAADLGAFLFEYGAFQPPLAEGPTGGDLPGNNVAYRRRALVEECAEVLRREGFNKPFIHEELRRGGGLLAIRPALRVRHRTSYRFLPFAARRFLFGRCFGAVRRRRSRGWRRLVLTVFAPVAPGLLVARHLGRCLLRPQARPLLWRAAPALVGICVAWGLGEWMGAWLGAGDACAKLY